jgi:hypothetical protein
MKRYNFDETPKLSAARRIQFNQAFEQTGVQPARHGRAAVDAGRITVDRLGGQAGTAHGRARRRSSRVQAAQVIHGEAE